MAGTDDEQVMGLVEFMKQKKRDACPVCQLPDEVRKQLSIASDKGIKRRHQLEWLKKEVGVELTNGDLNSHYAGRHDEP